MTTHTLRHSLKIGELLANIELLEAAADPSARSCAADARRCLDSANANEAFPGLADSELLPRSWRESAERWAEQGAEHEWGWQRNRPASWLPTRWARS